MGRDRYRILDDTAPHFLTCTVVQWLPLFAQPANAQIVLDALGHLQRWSVGARWSLHWIYSQRSVCTRGHQ
jgi:hypothetical protein